MTRTIRRPPSGVNVNSYKDFNINYFGYNNWKGICDDKNYLTVDQETFAEASNVYVDKEGILRSRPAIQHDALYSHDFGSNSIVHKIWNFNALHSGANASVQVYQLKNTLTNQYELRFFVDGIEHVDPVETVVIGENCTIIYNENKLYIFTDTKILTYNTDTYRVDEAEDTVYIPETKIVSNNIVEDNESPNALTNLSKTVYLYDSKLKADGTPTSDVDLAPLIGKTVDVTVGDETYTNVDIVSEYQKKSFASNKLYLGEEYSHIAISRYGSIIVQYPDNTFKYSAKGISFDNTNPLPVDQGTDIIAKDVRITDDGLFAYIMCYCTVEGQQNNYLFVMDLSAYGTKSWIVTDIDVTGNCYDIHLRSLSSYTKLINDGNGLRITIVHGSTSVTQNFTKDYPSGAKISTPPTAIDDTQTYSLNNQSLTLYNAKLHSIVIGSMCYNSIQIAVTNNTSERNGVWNLFAITNMTASTPYTISAFYRSATTDLSFVAQDSNYVSSVGLFSTVIRGNYPNVMNTAKILRVSYQTDGWVSQFTNINNDTNNAVKLNDENSNVFMTNTKMYVNDDYFFLLTRSSPLGITPIKVQNTYDLDTGFTANDTIYYVYRNSLFSSINLPLVKIYEKVLNGNTMYNYLPFNHYNELNEYYFSVGNTLYISEEKRGDNNEFLWYLPTIAKQDFSTNITNIHPLSTEQMGVFLESEIWLVGYSAELRSYYYTKSKVQVGCLEGSDVITSIDGQFTIFSCVRGLVALSYQNFVASTDQILNVLSDNVFELFNDYTNNNKEPVKLWQYVFWLIAYNPNSKQMFVYDYRNGSWWIWEMPERINNVFLIHSDIYFVFSNDVCGINLAESDYKDIVNNKEVKISWLLTSQKLHFTNVTFYKHIANIAFHTLGEGDLNAKRSFQMYAILYRSFTEGSGKPKMISYHLDIIRTFIQRLNYSKLQAFQFTLTSNDEDAIQYPLMLSTLTIKYNITSQVR